MEILEDRIAADLLVLHFQRQGLEHRSKQLLKRNSRLSSGAKASQGVIIEMERKRLNRIAHNSFSL